MQERKQFDVDKQIVDYTELIQVPGATSIQDPTRCEEEVYYVLVEETEGEAALRVNSDEPGQRLEAYTRVQLWFAGITAFAVTEKTSMKMHLYPPRHEDEIAYALWKWAEHGKNSKPMAVTIS